MNSYINRLKVAIRRAHKCDAIHVETVPVEEIFKGKTIWHGEVEVFKFKPPREGDKCYAWGVVRSTGTLDITMVLHEPPVQGPKDAVKVAIAVHLRELGGLK